MTQPCSAQNLCKSRISDWKLKAAPLALKKSARPWAIWPAAGWRARGDIGAADLTGGKVLGIDRRPRRRHATARQVARDPVQPAIAHPRGGDDKDDYHQLRKGEHRGGLLGAARTGQGVDLSNTNPHSPKLAHRRRASIQSARSAIMATGSLAVNGSRRQNGHRRRSTANGRSLTLSP